MMAKFITDIVKNTDKLCKKKFNNEKLRRYYQNNDFVSTIKPGMSIKEYVHRLAMYLHISESWFILALVYIDRLTEQHPRILVNSYTIHRILSTSIILAMKFNEDLAFPYRYIASVCGVSEHELLELELSFLNLINYEWFVDSETFESYYSHLSKMTGKRAMLSNCSCLEPAHSTLNTSRNRHQCRSKDGKNLPKKVLASQNISYETGEEISTHYGSGISEVSQKAQLHKHSAFSAEFSSTENSKLWKLNREMKQCHSKSGERNMQSKNLSKASHPTENLSASSGWKVTKSHQKFSEDVHSGQKTLARSHDTKKEGLKTSLYASFPSDRSSREVFYTGEYPNWRNPMNAKERRFGFENHHMYF